MQTYQYQQLKANMFFGITLVMATIVYSSFIWMLWFRDFSLLMSIVGSVFAVISYNDLIKHFVAWRYTLWRNNQK